MAIVRLDRLKKSNDIENRTPDLRACSIVRKPTTVTRPQTEMSARNLAVGKRLLVRKADLTAICELIV
jgi:hypothetical protein